MLKMTLSIIFQADPCSLVSLPCNDTQLSHGTQGAQGLSPKPKGVQILQSESRS